MAYCEKCGTKGFDPSVMYADPVTRAFLGPCCSMKSTPTGEPEYGFAMSSKHGLMGYLSMKGLDIKFSKSLQEIMEWYNNHTNQTSVETSPTTPPTTTPLDPPVQTSPGTGRDGLKN